MFHMSVGYPFTFLDCVNISFCVSHSHSNSLSANAKQTKKRTNCKSCLKQSQEASGSIFNTSINILVHGSIYGLRSDHYIASLGCDFISWILIYMKGFELLYIVFLACLLCTVCESFVWGEVHCSNWALPFSLLDFPEHFILDLFKCILSLWQYSNLLWNHVWHS